MENKQTPLSEKVFYKTDDGTQICALVQLSQGLQRGTVVLAHGISVDKHEEGVFINLAQKLSINGFHSLRFDYRGHGESGGAQEDMTITGEIADLSASIEYAKARFGATLGIVAASFGAVSTCCYLEANDAASCLVLWNPVLDLKQPFLIPYFHGPNALLMRRDSNS